ncbi:MIP/aquaporin family protein [Plastoroseomonas arctica]|uniref:Aquaporin family protein n=1 Tax=Plastoroseomonas arctica TaxID=1509237 RepID=A0AAF1KIY5_9PROT|nr:MIP/aquaporin family protein [Plastoroseomonas arctica]MBR0654510.1 aquaporin family protein [Plastoroseomonas arctica]
MRPELTRALAAEALGTLLLVAVVVGSGIMAQRLAGGNDALALLGNTLATGAALPVLILIFGGFSGAHFNPAVTLVMAARRELPLMRAIAYLPAQALGGVAGTMLAHAMFELPLLEWGTRARTGPAQWLAEAVATAMLLLTILGIRRSMVAAVPFAVGLTITAGYWVTASTSFANPAVTLARAFTTSFSGIAPGDVAGFALAQMFGATLAATLWRWFAGEGGIAYSAPRHDIVPSEGR